MANVINTFQKTTEDGLVEVKELDNGMKIESLIEPSDIYIQNLTNDLEPAPIPSETDLLGQQLVEKDLQILELQQDNETLGQQLVDIDLRLLKGGI